MPDGRPAPSSVRPIRVLFVDHVAVTSGAELAMCGLIAALGPRVEATAVLGEPGPLEGRLREAGAAVRVLPLAARVRQARRAELGRVGASAGAVWSLARYVLALRRTIRATAPDLVHTNSLKAHLYGGLAARLAGVPVVWHLRDRIAADYLPPTVTRLVRSAARVLPSAVVANSRSTLSTVPAPGIAEVVPNCVRPPAATARRADPDGAFTFAVLGRLAPWKGQDVFLRAFARAFPDGPARARVVGAPLFGEDAYAEELHRLAADLGIADRVEFAGHRDDVWAELAAIDVLVHCSTVPEPFGQVVLEGMAAGVPVIAAAAGGPAETITDGVDGMLTRMGDADALATAMRALSEDPVLRERLAGAGRATADRYSPAATAAAMVEVYRRVLRRPDAARAR